MTISALDLVRVQQNGDGINTLFPYGYPLQSDAEIEVIKTDTLTNTDSPQVLNVDYTVVGVPVGGPYLTGADIVFVVPPLATDRITLVRKTDKDQDQSFLTSSKFPAAILERIHDKFIMIVQELQEEISRSIVYPASVVGAVLNELPLPDAGKALVWNATEDGLENSVIDIASLATAVADAQAAALAAQASAATASSDAASAAASAVAAAAAAASVPTPDIDSITTVNSTPTPFASVMATTNNSAGRLIVDILAHEAATNDGMLFRNFVSYKNNAGTVTLDHTDDVELGDQVGVWSVDYNVSGTDIEIVVTGEAAKTIDWSYEIFQDEQV